MHASPSLPPPAASAPDPFEYVGFWRRLAVALLDALISLPLIPAHFWALERSISLRSAWPAVGISVVWLLLTTTLVVRFGGTPAKLILGMRIVNASGRFLSFPKALLRGAFDWADVLLYGLSVLNTLAMLPPYQSSPIGPWHASQLHERFSGIWGDIHEGWFFVILADVLVVAANHRKRALHDFLAGSFVITRRSCSALPAAPSLDATVEQ